MWFRLWSCGCLVDPESWSVHVASEVIIHAERNRADELRHLLSASPTRFNLNYRTEDSITPLIAATRQGCYDSALFLLKNGAQPDYPDTDGKTPLMYAAEEGFDRIVALLLVAGAKVSLKDKRGQTVLHYIFADHMEELGLWLGPRDVDGVYRALPPPPARQVASTFHLLLAAGACLTEPINSSGRSALDQILNPSLMNDYSHYLKILLDYYGPEDLLVLIPAWWIRCSSHYLFLKKIGLNSHATDERGRNIVFHVATEKYLRYDFLWLLLDEGLDFQTPDRQGKYLIQQVNYSVAVTLLAYGAPEDQCPREVEWANPPIHSLLSLIKGISQNTIEATTFTHRDQIADYSGAETERYLLFHLLKMRGVTL